MLWTIEIRRPAGEEAVYEAKGAQGLQGGGYKALVEPARPLPQRVR